MTEGGEPATAGSVRIAPAFQLAGELRWPDLDIAQDDIAKGAFRVPREKEEAC